MIKLDNTLYFYKQIRDKLLKYKEDYEKDLPLTASERDYNYVKGHINMINILLDDLDSESGIAWLGVDLAEPEPKSYRRKICESNCEECIFAIDAKNFYLKDRDSTYDAVSDYMDFIDNCRKENGVE